MRWLTLKNDWKMFMLSAAGLFSVFFCPSDAYCVVVADSTGNQSCVTEMVEQKVRNDANSPIINQDETIQINLGFYKCNSPQRGDLVAFRDSRLDRHFDYRIIKGMPGDHWELKTNDSGKYELYINKELLTNSEGQAYSFEEADIVRLKLYTDDYPVIPDGAYFMIQNRLVNIHPDDIGLITKEVLAGNVIIPPPQP